MYHQARLYDLSFISSKKRSSTKSQLVFTFERKYLSECISRLETITGRSDTEKYCGQETHFRMPVPDLFGNIEFGYGGCGLVAELENEVSFCVELCEAHLHNATMTIHVLTQTFLGQFEGEPEHSNRSQQVDLETGCAHMPHGHSVGGYVSGEVREWLRRQWHKGPTDNWAHWAPMPQEVLAAMRQTWIAVSPKDLKRWAKDCGGSITEDGRFILNCFGNACDLAIYPDNACIDEYSSVRFSCHNLDAARQQLTLLAGLAKLCELARTDSS